jgi:hypothetical protein
MDTIPDYLPEQPRGGKLAQGYGPLTRGRLADPVATALGKDALTGRNEEPLHMMTTRLHDQIEEWRKRLLDLSKRNRLVNCKIGARAAVEIVYPDPELVWQRVVVNGNKMSFAWKRDLLDEEDDEKGAPQLSLFLEEGEDANRSNIEHVDKAVDKREPSAPKRSAMEDCLASPFLREEHLITEMADQALRTRLNRLSLNAKTSITEQGINVLYLAFGLLRWYESPDSDVSLFSPLLLVPVQLDRDGPDAPWKLSLHEEEIFPNHSLRLHETKCGNPCPTPVERSPLFSTKQRNRHGRRFGNAFHRISRSRAAWTLAKCPWRILEHGLTGKRGQ